MTASRGYQQDISQSTMCNESRQPVKRDGKYIAQPDCRGSTSSSSLHVMQNLMEYQFANLLFTVRVAQQVIGKWETSAHNSVQRQVHRTLYSLPNTSSSGQEIDYRQFLNLFAIFAIHQGSFLRVNVFIDAFFWHVFLILYLVVQENVANLVSLSCLYT